MRVEVREARAETGAMRLPRRSLAETEAHLYDGNREPVLDVSIQVCQLIPQARRVRDLPGSCARVRAVRRGRGDRARPRLGGLGAEQQPHDLEVAWREAAQFFTGCLL